MSLADRLDSVRRAQAGIGETSQVNRDRRPARHRANDPFADVKGRVHQKLIENLGPRLYDPHLPEVELAAQVRQTLQETIDAENTPLSHADRTRIAQ
jgi:pilus assembly protein CpaF